MKGTIALVLWGLTAAAVPVAAAIIRTVRIDGESTTKPGPDTRPALSKTLSIRVLGNNWGDANPSDIRTVLESAGGELWRNFPSRRLHPIIVQKGRWAPITLYRRGPGGEYLIRLTPDGRYWCQFTYQFAHEFCHVLANYTHKTPRANKWFEESLCETASIYTLRRMAIAWEKTPPRAEWSEYYKDIQLYADDLQKASDKLPEGKTLAVWYKANSAALRRAPWLRDKNRIVANSLLELFEADPSGWAAIEYLNSGKAASDSFQDYLSNWYLKTPKAHRKIVGDIIRKFELEIPKPQVVKPCSSRAEPAK